MGMLLGGPISTGDYVRSVPESTPLPPGIYRGITVKATSQDLDNNGNRIMLTVEFDITHPEEYSNRNFWDRFNIVNPSVDATRISKEALADLGAAAGLATINDEEDLIGHEVQMELVIEPAKPYIDKQNVKRDGKASNKCKKYWPLGVEIKEAKTAQKAAAPVARPAATNTAQKWGGQLRGTAVGPQGIAQAATTPPAAASAPAQTQQAAPQPQASAAPAGNVAPWKRNKQ